MEIEVLGIGNAFTAEHYSTSFLIRSEKTILVDGPPGLFRLLQEREIQRESIDGVLVTHVHGDHVAGLEALILWRRYHVNARTRIYTTSPVYQELKSGFFQSFAETFAPSLRDIVRTNFEDYVDWIRLSDEGINELDDGLVVEIRYNWHPTPTLGLKFKTNHGSLGISGDTCYRPRLLKELYASGRLSEKQFEKLAGNWLWEADLIYHEADRSGEQSPHTQEADLLTLSPEIREKIRLVHIPDGLQEEALPIAREGEKVKIDAAGLRLEIPR